MRRFLRIVIKLLNYIPAFFLFLPRKSFEGGKYSTTFFRGSGIIISNHNAFLDFILFIYLFAGRNLRCLVGRKLYESSPFMKFIMDLFEGIPVDQFSSDLTFLMPAMDHLRKGGVLLIFPEGKLNKDNEELPYKSSAAVLSLQTGAPVIPVYHTHSYGFLKPTGIALGDPIDLMGIVHTKTPGAEQLKEVSEFLRQKVGELEKSRG